MELLCPVCHGVLNADQKVFRCKKGHCFDIARQGYLNLLTVQEKHSLHPGDTHEQVTARREFLEAGLYAPIRDTLLMAVKKYHASGPILDIGCGEGYYCTALAKELDANLIGIDISKEAVRYAAGKYKWATWICGTAAHLPIADKSIGLITSLFALTVPAEFHRCLRSDGLFLQILAAEDHLLGLKSIIYPNLKLKPKNLTPEIPGFALLNSIPIRFDMRLTGKQVQNILYMTPHIYRIGKDGLLRLQETQTLCDTASCILNIYQTKKI